MDNNYYMMEKHTKNSLLGQLEQNGIINENNTEVEPLPFGILSKGLETSPFGSDEEETETKEDIKDKKIIKKRLNDLDNNIFQDTNFININDEELSKEEKNKKIKALIKKLDEKIFMLEDSDDEILLKKLNDEKEILTDALKLLDDEEDNISNPIKQNANVAIEKIAKGVHLYERIKKIENFIFKFCPVLYKSFLVRKALNKLIMLNENARELMLKKIPYGESELRYSDFIAYLSCANVIHAKLTKKI